MMVTFKEKSTSQPEMVKSFKHHQKLPAGEPQ